MGGGTDFSRVKRGWDYKAKRTQGRVSGLRMGGGKPEAGFLILRNKKGFQGKVVRKVRGVREAVKTGVGGVQVDNEGVLSGKCPRSLRGAPCLTLGAKGGGGGRLGFFLKGKPRTLRWVKRAP